ncbi:MAG: glycosyltransferase family 4 protein [Gemmatimonadetes bacterium]|jgi:glycosyltransferase involved in cell wall biosynthesis|nr:glycosyltransferase family 4 protein [Gemmatimonadota bacterium]MBT4611012.1 glycosyltransferase family 4 protein [Gemmatimonadota bacterium]MBT5142497.1 glycosyltransferase family 4 protein [Gemmatimonadota bacterium]MBT5586427.1 glycosyltransferase family 4 protein [Gemmatimonadota bacterium]MBT5961206.1 glycosyltransferase family 4 protein [Gemmatimonadota bacterium]
MLEADATMPQRQGRERVLHVITRLDRGGSAENTLLTVAHLDPERYDITLAVGPSEGPMSPTLELAQQAGVEVVQIPHLIRAPSPWHDLRALLCLWRVCRGFDLVHTHTSKAGVIGRLAARLARVPHTVHTPHGHVFYGYYSSPVTRFFVLLERLAARWCERIVALTDADLADHLAFDVAPASQFIVIHSGVELQALDASQQTSAKMRESLGIPQDAFVVGTLGRLTQVKGQHDLLRAMARLETSPWLLLVGDGEEEASLRRLAQELGISQRVVFAGWRQDTGDALRSMDLFAFPSLNEGMGKALVEAMYLRRPVVATHVGGIPHLLEDGHHGLLVPPRSVPQLAQAIDRLMRDRNLGRQLGEAAHLQALSYGVAPMVDKIDALYRELMVEAEMATKA